MASITTRSQIGAEDIAQYDGINATFTRRTSTGGDLTLSRVGYEVDVASVYGDGNPSQASLETAIATISSRERVLVLRQGTWSITDALTIPANFHLRLAPGAILSIAADNAVTIAGRLDVYGDVTLLAGTTTLTLSGLVSVFNASSLTAAAGTTLTLSGTVSAGTYQIFAGAGTIALTGVSVIYASWYATPPSDPSAITADTGSLFVAESGDDPLWYKDDSDWKQVVAGNYVGLTGNEEVAGTKTFTSFPVTPEEAPDADYEVANKKYVDDNIPTAATDTLRRANYLRYSDTKSINTSPQTSAANAWTTRDLTTEDVDYGTLGSLGSNQITLGAGWYYCQAASTLGNVAVARIRIYDVTNSSQLLISHNYYGYNDINATLGGYFMLSDTASIELQYYTKTAGRAMGWVFNASGNTEVYSVVELWRVGDAT